jgi:hypothetical protein
LPIQPCRSAKRSIRTVSQASASSINAPDPDLFDDHQDDVPDGSDPFRH